MGGSLQSPRLLRLEIAAQRSRDVCVACLVAPLLNSPPPGTGVRSLLNMLHGLAIAALVLSPAPARESAADPDLDRRIGELETQISTADLLRSWALGPHALAVTLVLVCRRSSRRQDRVAAALQTGGDGPDASGAGHPCGRQPRVQRTRIVGARPRGVLCLPMAAQASA